MDSSPIPGMLVGSNVLLKGLLGQGGMGSVWVAHHLSLQIDVAVKFLSPEMAEVDGAGARFQREAAAAAQLKSPHVVQVFDHGVTEQGLPYIVMELLEGEDLGKRIEQRGPRPLSEVLTIISQLARGLGVAHAQGIVHRDIKPENVMLIDADGELFVKLLDFGIAKRTRDHSLNVTSTRAMIGTPHFMSPEQVMSARTVDFRSDLWSVAAVAYVALTGKLPFEGETLGALCYAIIAGEFEPVTRLRGDLPPSLDAWFERAFQRDPSARFGSSKEMAAALELRLSSNPPPVESDLSALRRADDRRSVLPPAPRAQLGRALSEPPPRHPTSFDATFTAGRTPKKGRLVAVVAGVLAGIVAILGSLVFAALLFLPHERFEELRTAVTKDWLDPIQASFRSGSRAPNVDFSRDEALRPTPSSSMRVEPGGVPSHPIPVSSKPGSASVTPDRETSPPKVATPRPDSEFSTGPAPQDLGAPVRRDTPWSAPESGAGRSVDDTDTWGPSGEEADARESNDREPDYGF